MSDARQQLAGGGFLLPAGGGTVINPIEPGLEIVPDNPDYTLDPDGLGGSGKGIIGEAPIEIPYTITYSGAQKMRRLRSR